ncbi:SagB/ThcOx family dehydrogenase [Rhodococcus sp. 14-2483-1-2]|uniref:SagB/ThcOx family dehydrogenase n=1 Tax=Rhodococcus sp. 14-2483-1-2 TaxID=2023147 RepID=UPI000B9BBF8A|nr:SagB/ThcOx family dehydrogenase [Rhodococcus sp. 14-2483-1-2]OZF26177.1 hypothetical protein CH295_26540 [Rhodococcus sp. 14-2483-1-2]
MEATPNVTDLIFSGDPPGVGDPSEDYVEVSKLHRRMSTVEVPGVYMLETNPWMVEATARSGRTYDHRPVVHLPPVADEAPDIRLRVSLGGRRSPESFTAGASPTLDQLSAWCWSAAGRTAAISTVHHGRTYPSGGAMFPCDVFISLEPGEAVEGGTYYYDPGGHCLFHVGSAMPADFAATTPQPETFDNASAVWILAGALWRNRFKYGQRALRFTLLEAGHIAQNIVLAVMADDHAARAIGGFFDDELADLMAMDGVHDVPLYMVVSGQPGQGG